MRSCTVLVGTIFCSLSLSLLTSFAWSQANDTAAKSPEVVRAIDAETLARNAKAAVVTISVEGRDGARQGLGTGFIVSDTGLIATNLHVIGEARPIVVQLADGRKFDVSSVHASDKALDLAVLKVDGEKLPSLKLGSAAELDQGEPVIALGNPLGFKYSVVAGVLSARREVEGREMLQLAMPVEPGNSGGPVLDAAGQVVGIVTMKSLVTDNLGFAVQIDDLKPLLEKPNPVPIERWLTIGALDTKQWTPLFGARWQQRSGKIVASGAGDSFGGRSLCVSNIEMPKMPFEVGVNVRLEDEEGAAGLVFHSDGGDKHYGFYPSAGKLRLTRFDGPNVFTWQVLQNVDSPHYRRGDWNHLKVRIEKDKILCFVNDELVIESHDAGLVSGKLGLAKFRQTPVEFKQFRVAETLPKSTLDDEVALRLKAEIARLPPLAETTSASLTPLAKESVASVSLMRERAKQLKRQAEELTRLAADVHVAAVSQELIKALEADEDKIDLVRVALLIARLDDDEVDVEAYGQQVERMAADVRSILPEKADEATRLAALNGYLFEQQGFHGSRTDFYHRANSYLSRVIDDREGLPITLSVLYLELARRLDVKLVGVGLPGHFVVRRAAANGEIQLIDVFEKGSILRREDAARKVRELAGVELEDEHLASYTKLKIAQRILHNLLGIAQEADDREAVLRYLEALVAIDEADLQSRGLRAIYRFQTNRRAAALADLDWFLTTKPEGIDLDELRKMREQFDQTPLFE